MKLSALFSLLLCASAASAHEVRQHAPHVHGQAVLDLAVDGSVLELALTAPGIGIVDFERAPASDAERSALARAQRILGAGDWVQLPAVAGCRKAQATVDAEGFTAAADAGAAHHDHAHDHAHAGFSATARFDCTSPAALRFVDVRLPVLFPGLHEVIVNTVGPAGQGRIVVTHGNQRVTLAP